VNRTRKPRWVAFWMHALAAQPGVGDMDRRTLHGAAAHISPGFADTSGCARDQVLSDPQVRDIAYELNERVLDLSFDADLTAHWSQRSLSAVLDSSELLYSISRRGIRP